MSQQQTIPQVTVQDVKAAIDHDENVIILDVRNASEFERGRIKTSINLPLQEITPLVESAIPNKNQKVYVYCLSGSRSIFAVLDMLAKGYTNVFNVNHGLLAWRVHNYPTISGNTVN